MTDPTEAADMLRAENFRRDQDSIYDLLRSVRMAERERCVMIADAVAAAASDLALMTDDSEHVTITGIEIGALDVAARIRGTNT